MTTLPLSLLHRAERTDRTDRGASAVEYGLLIAGIAALIVAVIFAFHDTINGLFQNTCSSINNTAQTGTC